MSSCSDCYGTGASCAGCTLNCGGSCGACGGLCLGTCGGACTFQCQGSCSGSCGSGCSGSCTSCRGCSGGCSGCTSCSGCSGGCTGCTGCTGCSGSCRGGCRGCDGCTACTGSCTDSCNNGCTGSQNTTDYNHIRLGFSTVILDSDIAPLYRVSRREASRRGKSSSTTSFGVGNPATKTSINIIKNNLKNVDNSFNPTVNNKIEASLATSLINKATALYRQNINP